MDSLITCLQKWYTKGLFNKKTRGWKVPSVPALLEGNLQKLPSIEYWKNPIVLLGKGTPSANGVYRRYTDVIIMPSSSLDAELLNEWVSRLFTLYTKYANNWYIYILCQDRLDVMEFYVDSDLYCQCLEDDEYILIDNHSLIDILLTPLITYCKAQKWS